MSTIAPIQISMTIGIVIFIVLFEALDYYFYRQVFEKQSNKRILRIFHWSLNGLTLVSMLALLFLFQEQNNSFVQRLISAIFTLFLFQLWGKLLFLLFSLPRVWIKKKRLKTLFLRTGLVALAIVWIGMSVAVCNAFDPKVRTVEIQIDDLPASFEGYSIAFLSDIHLGVFGSDHPAIQKAIKMTNELSPDLILLGGDLVSLSSKEAFPYVDLFATLSACDGKFAVRGNHDYGIYNRVNPNLAEERIRFSEINRAMGITLLDNQSTALTRGKDTLLLIGTEYFNPERNFPDGLAKAMENCSDRHPIILLTHSPNHYAASVLNKQPIALTLSGHTHAMQFVVELFGLRWSPSSILFRHWGGLYVNGNQSLYVNEGLGSSLYSIRWGTPSEITHLILRGR